MKWTLKKGDFNEILTFNMILNGLIPIFFLCYCIRKMSLAASSFSSIQSFDQTNWLKLHLITYNVGTSNPSSDFYDLLSLNKSSLKSDHSDVIVISLQEVDSKILHYAVDLIYDDPWTNRLSTILEVWNYVKVKTVRLQGLVLNLFCLRKHLANLRDIDVEFTKTGLFGIWGNKGAVSIRFDINGSSLCFINAHLAAHETKLDDRIDDYNDILKNHKFHVSESNIFLNEYVFWMGDLNFRLKDDFDLSFDEIVDLIDKKDYKLLLDNDELRYVMKSDQAFGEFQEIEPTFPPTFKFEIGTCKYDEKRKPAWTDRILFAKKQNSASDANSNVSIQNLFYKAHLNYVQSDHKPVSASFNIKISEQSAKEVVIFEKISQWLVDGDNEVIYKITISNHAYPNKWDEYEDWIGVFQDGFISLDDYISYVYTDTNSQLVSKDKSFLYFSVKFADALITKIGMYRLVYFQRLTNKVQSILGISDPFPVIAND